VLRVRLSVRPSVRPPPRSSSSPRTAEKALLRQQATQPPASPRCADGSCIIRGGAGGGQEADRGDVRGSRAVRRGTTNACAELAGLAVTRRRDLTDMRRRSPDRTTAHQVRRAHRPQGYTDTQLACLVPTGCCSNHALAAAAGIQYITRARVLLPRRGAAVYTASRRRSVPMGIGEAFGYGQSLDHTQSRVVAVAQLNSLLN